METKSIFKSKTFWFNIITGLIGVATAVTPTQLEQLGIDSAHQAQIMLVLGAIVTVGNIYLRAVTNSAVTLKKGE